MQCTCKSADREVKKNNLIKIGLGIQFKKNLNDFTENRRKVIKFF